MNCKRKMNINLTDLQSVTVDDGVCDVTRSVLTSELLTPDLLVWGLNVSPPPQARRPANHHPSLRDAVRRGEWRGGRGQARDPGAQARVRRRHNSLWWSPAELHDEYTPTIYSKTQLTVQKDGGCTVRSTGREFGCSVALSTMIGVTIYAHFLTLALAKQTVKTHQYADNRPCWEVFLIHPTRFFGRAKYHNYLFPEA